MSEKAAPGNGTEREFLHDLSNPLAIAYGGMKLISVKMENQQTTPISLEEIQKKLEKAILYFEKANQLIDERRKFLQRTSTEEFR